MIPRVSMPTSAAPAVPLDVCVCVCVCVLFPSILVTVVPHIKARPVLHFAACFSVRLNQPGSKRRGRIPEAFFFTAVFASMPHLLLRCFASIFYREKGPAVPSVVDNEVELCQLAKLFAFYRFRSPATKMTKNHSRRDSNP